MVLSLRCGLAACEATEALGSSIVAGWGGGGQINWADKGVAYACGVWCRSTHSLLRLPPVCLVALESVIPRLRHRTGVRDEGKLYTPLCQKLDRTTLPPILIRVPATGLMGKCRQAGGYVDGLSRCLFAGWDAGDALNGFDSAYSQLDRIVSGHLSLLGNSIAAAVCFSSNPRTP